MNTENLAIALLSDNAYLQVNKKLLLYTECNTKAIIVLSELISQYKFVSSTNNLDINKFFYCTINYLKNKIGMSEYNQRKAIFDLKEYGFIEEQLKGLPRKRFFRINFDKIFEILSKEEIKPVIKKSSDFYTDLNISIKEKDFVTYLGSIDNMNKTLAFGLFYWTKLLQKKHNLLWEWNSETLGILRLWISKEKKTGPIDWSYFNDFFISQRIEEIYKVKTYSEILKLFFWWKKSALQKPHSQRKENVKELLEEINE